MKKITLIWVIIATLFAVIATIFYIEPAATLIDWSASPDGSFYIAFPIAVTWLLCVSPLFLILLINNFIQNRKNKLPVDLSGKTGIIIQREKELQNAALQYGVLVNGKVAKRVGMGKKVFLELSPGNYTLQTKVGKWKSAEVNIELTQGKILAYSTSADMNKVLTTLIPKGEMLLLTQIPYS